MRTTIATLLIFFVNYSNAQTWMVDLNGERNLLNLKTAGSDVAGYSTYLGASYEFGSSPAFVGLNLGAFSAIDRETGIGYAAVMYGVQFGYRPIAKTVVRRFQPILEFRQQWIPKDTTYYEPIKTISSAGFGFDYYFTRRTSLTAIWNQNLYRFKQGEILLNNSILVGIRFHLSIK
ncbi:MAG: hypothetical protein RL660_2401 [Bacteroidota bacterium]|jgi:hypothetical protein